MATTITGSCVIDDINEEFLIDAPGRVIQVKAAKNVAVISCGNLNCYGAKITGNLNCRNATITGDLNCHDAKIDGSLNCRNAKIDGNLNCRNATIGGSLNCHDATISGIKITDPTEEELILLREIYAIISAEPNLLVMSSWHCGTSHCLAGWCQVLRDNIAEDNYALVAGQKYLPSLSYLFFSTDEIVINKLKELCE